MKICLCYIMVPAVQELAALHSRFINSYLAFPPGVEHYTTIICNGSAPSDYQRSQFAQFPDLMFYERSNEGWDIGGFLEYSKYCGADMMICMGSNTFLNRAGWMKRFVEARQKHGAGLYGAFASYEIRPHLNTTAFCVAPDLLRRCPSKVETKAERYDWEHGPNNFWQMIAKEGLPTKLVLWSGEYDWQDWRKPQNIFRRGNQSNCLCGWRLTQHYAEASAKDKAYLERVTDTLTVKGFQP